MMKITSALRRDLGQAFAIVVGSAVLGLVVNEFRAEPLSLVYVNARQRLSQQAGTDGSFQPREVGTTEVRDLIAAKSALLIDARPASFYDHAHIPGAVSLPNRDFDQVYPNVAAKIEQRGTRLIVVYCSSVSCEDAWKTARKLFEKGVRNLAVYSGGWEQWEEAGNAQPAQR